MAIHPTAIVDREARVAETAEIGPYCILGPAVTIGAGTRLMAYVYVEGPTVIGQDNTFFPYSSVGVAPQDLKYKGERSSTHIGHRNRIREFVTIHRGTEAGRMLTSVGNDSLLSAYCHVAHDSDISDHVILSHGATIGGHVTIADFANIGAWSGIHQFCRVGRYAMVGGYSVVTQDVLPYSITVSHREIKVFGANRVGLERQGFDNEVIESLQTAFRLLTRAGLNTSQAMDRIRAELDATPELEELLAFISTSERGFVK